MAIRNTKTKTRVLNIFQESAFPLTLSEAFAKVKAKLPDTAYSTVYRIVQNLKDEAKLISLDWRDRNGRFEWAERKHHHHMTCSSCGKIADVDDKILNFKTHKVKTATGFLVEMHSIELIGTCEPCQIK